MLFEACKFQVSFLFFPFLSSSFFLRWCVEGHRIHDMEQGLKKLRCEIRYMDAEIANDICRGTESEARPRRSTRASRPGWRFIVVHGHSIPFPSHPNLDTANAQSAISRALHQKEVPAIVRADASA